MRWKLFITLAALVASFSPIQAAPIPLENFRPIQAVDKRANGQICNFKMRKDHQNFCRENNFKFVFQQPNDKDFGNVTMTEAEVSNDKVPLGTQCDHFVELQWIERQVNSLTNARRVCQNLRQQGQNQGAFISAINHANNLYFVDWRVNRFKAMFFGATPVQQSSIDKRTAELQQATLFYIKSIKGQGHPERTARGIVEALNTYGSAEIPEDTEKEWVTDLEGILNKAIASINALPPVPPAQVTSTRPKRCRPPSADDDLPPPKRPKARRQVVTTPAANGDPGTEEEDCSLVDSSNSAMTRSATITFPLSTGSSPPPPTSILPTNAIASSALPVSQSQITASPQLPASSTASSLSLKGTVPVLSLVQSAPQVPESAISANQVSGQSSLATPKTGPPVLSPPKSSPIPLKSSAAAYLAASTKRLPPSQPTLQTKPSMRSAAQPAAQSNPKPPKLAPTRKKVI